MERKIRIREKFEKSNDVTLYHGSCVDLLRGMPSESAQLIVTSPPYNVGKEYEKNATIEEYMKLQREVIHECVRITKVGGSICWQTGTHVNGHGQIIPLDLLLYPVFALYAQTDKVRLRNRIVWTFEHGLNCDNRFSGRYETILWYTKGDSYKFNLDVVRVPQKYPGKRGYKGKNRGTFTSNPLGKNPGDVWALPNVKANHAEKTGHPCQFPIELPERLILALTKKNDLVVDPFLGAGTTAVAAIIHRRRAAGADLKKVYLRITRDRIQKQIIGSLKRRPFGKPIYQPRPNTPLTTYPFGAKDVGVR
jgi:adenine-specific DNA-methyltransferase